MDVETPKSLGPAVMRGWIAFFGCAPAFLLLFLIASTGMLRPLPVALIRATLILALVVAPLLCAASSVALVVRTARVREVTAAWAGSLLAAGASLLLAFLGIGMAYVGWQFAGA